MTEYKYDAFISHNSTDKPVVESIATTLEAQGLLCFLDKWDILPRDQWLRNLETGLIESRTILLFIGTQGIGPYQQAEADAALRRQIQQLQDCIIPVLLPGASPEDIGQLSLFLQGTNALRFQDLNDPLPHRILAGMVRGDDCNYLRQLIREKADASDDLLQTLNHWQSGLHIQWHKEECQVREGPGTSCLSIPDLSSSPNPDSIEYLLNWKSRLTEMIGRERELKILHDWANTASKLSIRLLFGEGGTGKTRLAFELAVQLKEKGWQAGEAQGLEGNWYTGSAGTLLIIDYPEQRSEKVTALLEALAIMQPPERKLRIFLLGRNGDFLRKLPQTAQSLVAPPIKLSALVANDTASWSLFQRAWQRLHELKSASVPPLPMMPEAFEQWQQQAELRRRPLFILALALRLTHDPDAKDLAGKDILRVLTHQYEVLRLRKEAKQRGMNEYSLVMLRALAAMSGRIESEALRELIQSSTVLKLDIHLPRLSQLKDTSLWSQHAIHALQPDLLAADLLHYALTELAVDQSGLWQYLGLEAAVDFAEATSIFGRLIHDAHVVLDQPWPLSSFSKWICHEPERCQKLNLALNRSNLEGTLLPLAIATGEVLLAQATSRQWQAIHLNNLSNRLAESGEREAGLQAIRRAVEIYEQLAADNFAADGFDLASSLNNLSNRLSESGEREAGLQAIRRSIEIRERLAAGNFAAYGPSLARGLNNLSNRLAESGEREAALRAVRRAAEIHQQLAEDNFAAYGSDLARSLNNLSNHLAESGEREAGLQAIRRAVEIRERLAAGNFAAYGSDLASSLNNLSNRLAESGEREAGLQAIRRTVEIREQLAAENFAAYGPALAGNLNNLSVRLSESGEREASLQAIRRAVAIYEQLAADNLAAYGPYLAMSLNNLSNGLVENGEREAGLQAIRRAVEIREQLAAENFAAYGPTLAGNLYTLLIHLGEAVKDAEVEEIKAQLENVIKRVMDERVQIPTGLAWLFN